MTKIVTVVPLLAFLGFVTRLVVYGATLGDAIALVSITALCGLHAYLESKKELPVNESVKQDLQIVKDTVSGLKLLKTYGKQ